MSSRKWQRGEGKAGCIFWILIFLIGGLVAWQMIPPKIADMQLWDHIEEIAKLEPRKSGEWFRESIYRRASQLKIPLKKKGIKVDKTLRRVQVDLEYVVVLDFIVTTYEWKFGKSIERDIFLM